MKCNAILLNLPAFLIGAGFVAQACAADTLNTDTSDEETVVRGQTWSWPYVIDLDERSQTNVIVRVSVDPPQQCPLIYTNVLSNTNLFTPAERELLLSMSAKYQGVTTNSGPPGTVLVGLSRAVVHWAGYDRESVLTHFAYTNSAAREDVAFLASGHKAVKYQSKPGCGYYAMFFDNALFAYDEFNEGKLNGLFTELRGDHCVLWVRFTNGKALGKVLFWAPREINPLSWGLAAEAEFKEPYDFLQYQQRQFDLTWLDSPRIMDDTNSIPGKGTRP